MIVMQGLENISIYLDDILIISSNFNDQLKYLEPVLARLRKHNLKLNPKKFLFCTPTLQYLGYTLSEKYD